MPSNNDPAKIYFVNNIIELFNPNVTLSVKLIEDLRVALERRSQILLVRIEGAKGIPNGERDLPLTGTELVAKFYDSAYYTPASSEWEGSTGDYMEYLAQNEATAYERLRSLYDRCVPRFFGKWQSKNNGPVPVILLRHIKGIPLTQPALSLDIIRKYEAKTMENLGKIHSHGVAHGDIRGDNILWAQKEETEETEETEEKEEKEDQKEKDGEKDRILFIDFELAQGDDVYFLSRDKSWLSSVFSD